MTDAAGPPPAGAHGTRFMVSADRERCQGHARCWEILPELFSIDGDGYSALGRGVPVPAGLEEQAQRAVASCPELALSIEPVSGTR
jgi:ferredoxin